MTSIRPTSSFGCLVLVSNTIDFLKLNTQIDTGLVTIGKDPISVLYVDSHCDIGVRIGQSLKLVFVFREKLRSFSHINGTRSSVFLFLNLRHLNNNNHHEYNA